jgi:excinuclease ABC subunit C
MAAQLEEEMRKAAAAQDYERAAQLRDAVADLKRSTRKTREFARVPYTLPVAINPENDLAELARILSLPHPPERIEGFDISNISGTFAVASLVSFHRGRPDRARYRRFRIKTVTGQDDFACMAEAVQRRYSRLLREARGDIARVNEEDRGIAAELQVVVDETSRRVRRGERASTRPAGGTSGPGTLPDLILIDGGKGQLNAAMEELRKLGLERIPVIGLAKEFEEIYLPGQPVPLRPGLDSPAVKLLQRVRDESHRVANGYNAQLRLRKISESILDEFPGIGGTRKAALLKKFGSIQRLRVATVEQIAAVSGFGEKLAMDLKTFLATRQG